ncbi:MAG: lysophospholipid acyltransferase family protein [Proteobacteria bacterium]|nr:lysophospholipid acyltransferase family protein [Pseudomonadota bacterium]
MIARALRALWTYAVLLYGFGLLGIGGLVWSLLALPLTLVLPAKQARAVGRGVITRGFRFYLGALQASGGFRFDLSALDALRDAGPLILAPNHPSLLDAVMLLSRAPQAVCVLKASLFDSVFFGAGARLAGYIGNESPIDMVRRSADELRRGRQLLLFPEGTRTTHAPLNSFRGAFSLIARQAGVPVQTVFIEADSGFLGKGWPLLRRPAMPLHYRVRLGRRFEPPRELHAFMLELERYFASELQAQSATPQPLPACVESHPV